MKSLIETLIDKDTKTESMGASEYHVLKDLMDDYGLDVILENLSNIVTIKSIGIGRSQEPGADAAEGSWIKMGGMLDQLSDKARNLIDY